MLRLKSFTVLMIALFVMPVFAQAVPEKAVEVVNPLDIFESIAALAGFVLLVTAAIKSKLNTNRTITIVVSGIIGIGTSAIGYFFQHGIFVAVEWWYIFIYGFTAMLIANGLATWEFIKAILEFFKLRTPANKVR
ncbi:MAG: hypothetical protein M5U17_01965 [Ignavibacterium sp.]|nr:hypothetical protein [Ignavibacterium sp.]